MRPSVPAPATLVPNGAGSGGPDGFAASPEAAGRRVNSVESRESALTAVDAKLHFVRFEIEDRTPVASDCQERHLHWLGAGRRLCARAGLHDGRQQDEYHGRDDAMETEAR